MIVVIGAGMAGLSAAHALSAAGQEVTVLEAKSRIGGRVYTKHDVAEHPVEFGAELIHGRGAAIWPLVNELGLHTVHWEKQEDAWVRLEPPHHTPLLTMKEARSQHPDFDITRSWKLPNPRPEVLANEDFASYLKRLGFSENQLNYVRRSYSNACGEEASKLSAKAILDGMKGEDSDDFRIIEGYDHLIKHLAQGLHIIHEAVVAIDWQTGAKAMIHSTKASYEADNVIITAPLGVLKAGQILFRPALPAEKRYALAGLSMGPVIKLIYVFDKAITPPHISSLYSAQNPPMWWSPSYKRGSEKQVWTAFVSSNWARDLISMPEADALDYGLKSLAQELGLAELKASASYLMNWPADPYTLGGYSVSLAGYHQARKKLAKATPPLFWAGEATQEDNTAATVHGAYLSGQRAAQEILKRQQRSKNKTIKTQAQMTLAQPR